MDIRAINIETIQYYTGNAQFQYDGVRVYYEATQLNQVDLLSFSPTQGEEKKKLFFLLNKNKFPPFLFFKFLVILFFFS
jgi:hypothetical protein